MWPELSKKGKINIPLRKLEANNVDFPFYATVAEINHNSGSEKAVQQMVFFGLILVYLGHSCKL